jgi:hypothetical protein
MGEELNSLLIEVYPPLARTSKSFAASGPDPLAFHSLVEAASIASSAFIRSASRRTKSSFLGDQSLRSPLQTSGHQLLLQGGKSAMPLA